MDEMTIYWEFHLPSIGFVWIERLLLHSGYIVFGEIFEFHHFYFGFG